MMLSDVIPVRKTLPIIKPVPALHSVIHRIDSWWVFRGRTFGGRERQVGFESAAFHETYCA